MPQLKKTKRSVFLIILLVFLFLIIIITLLFIVNTNLLVKKNIGLNTSSLPMPYNPLRIVNNVQEENKTMNNNEKSNSFYAIVPATKSAGSRKNSRTSSRTSGQECYVNSDCPSDYYSENYCDGINSAKDFNYFYCIDKKCVKETVKNVVEECADSCEEWGKNYCFNESVYHNRTCSNSSCEQGACIKRQLSEEKISEECLYGCENNSCTNKLGANIIIIQMDDTSAWWNVQVSNALVEAFYNANINLVVEVAPAGINQDLIFLNNVKKWNSYSNIEIAQGFYANDNFTPPQDLLDYNRTRENLQLGKLEFALAGISQPAAYIPAWSYGTNDTLNALRDEGFHTEMDYTTAPEKRDGINKVPLVIDNGLLLTNKDLSLKNKTEIKNAVDSMIAKKGFANLAFHHQEFGDGVPDNEKINNLIDILTELKSQGYDFLNAEDYYKHINSEF